MYPMFSVPLHANVSCISLFRGGLSGRGKEGGGEAAQREKERQQLLAEIDEKKRKILREVEVRITEAVSEAVTGGIQYL